MSFRIVIPARFASERLPGKPLADIHGVPMIVRVAQAASRASAEEVVIATGTNVEGEATASYLAGQLDQHPVKITRIASGVPIGGDLKYVDQMTLKRAMETRHVV